MTFPTADRSDIAASTEPSLQRTSALSSNLPGLDIVELKPISLVENLSFTQMFEPLVTESLEAVLNPLVFAGTSASEVIDSTPGDDILAGNGGRDVFVFMPGRGVDIITDFGGVGGGGKGESALLPEYDVLKFSGDRFIVENMLISFDGKDTSIRFTETPNFQLVLSDFNFTDLDNLPTGNSNIIFNGQDAATDSYDVFNDNKADSRNRLFNKNSVTYLNNANNRVSGFSRSDDVINGMAGDDLIKGLSGDDLLRGQAGNDRLFGGSGDDVLEGGEGHDNLKGDRGNDVLYGGTGRDRLRGGRGNDTLFGGPGKDKLFGAHGDDVIWSDQGGDDVYGGQGDDKFWVASEVFPDVPSTIYDFRRGHNLLGIDRLPGVQSFDDLSFRATKRGTIVSASGQDIVIIADRHPNELKTDDFCIIPGTVDPVDFSVALSLANDTGRSVTDGITSDPKIAGSIDKPAEVAQLFASVNGEDAVEVSEVLQADGTFELTRSLLESVQGSAFTDGTYTVSVTAVSVEESSPQTTDLSFQLDATAPALSLELDAESDSEPVGDGATTLGTVTLTGQTEPEAVVTLAETSAMTAVDSGGRYKLPEVDLALGENSFTASATDVAGNKSSVTSVVNRLPQDSDVPIVVAALANDTGVSDSDQLTSDPTVSGTVSDDNAVTGLRARFGEDAPQDFVDISAALSGDTFVLDRATLEEINGGPLSGGDQVLKLIAADEFGNESEIFELPFTLDTVTDVPIIDLAADSDSGEVGDQITTFGVVTLTGRVEPNARIELQGRGLTTQSDQDGVFSFEGVELVVGENAFAVVATDLASNVSSTTTTIRRQAADTEIPVVQAALVNDTGISDADGVTAEATIQGTVSDNTEVVGLRAGFNDASIADFVDVTSTLQNGAFTLTEDVLALVNGGDLPDGEYVLKLIAVDEAGNESAVTELPFLLDTSILTPTVALSTAFDSEVVGDRQTSLTNVTLSGETDADSLVELQNGAGRTVSDNAGQFALQNIELAAGENVFMAIATDAAGNQASSSITITRTQSQSLRNTAPVISSTPAITFSPSNGSYSYQLTATDADNDPLTYSLVNGPANAVMDEQGLLSWTPEAAAAGDYAFTVQVDDGQGGIATQQFTVTVEDIGAVGGSIAGQVWNDVDSDGQRNEVEQGFAGVTVYLDANGNAQLDAGEAQQLSASDDPTTTTIDETGQYSFEGISPGSYVVRQVVPGGYKQTQPGEQGYPALTVTDAEAYELLDFGNQLIEGTTENIAPVFISDPLENFSIPLPDTGFGDVSPAFLNLALEEGETLETSVSLTLTETSDLRPKPLDVVFLVDETVFRFTSGNMNPVPDLILQMDAALKEQEIDDVQYSMVGFAGDEARAYDLDTQSSWVELNGPQELLGQPSLPAPEGRFFGTAAEVAATRLNPRGVFDDGYNAMFSALSLPFRENSQIEYILLTTSIQDTVNTALNDDNIYQFLLDEGVTLSSIIRHQVRGNTTPEFADGVDSNGVLYYDVEGDGKIDVTTDASGEFEHVIDYAGIMRFDTLTQNLGGLIWNLDEFLRGDNESISAFGQVYAELVNNRVLSAAGNPVDLIAPAFVETFNNETGVLPATPGTLTYDISVDGTATAQQFTLSFVDTVSNELYGTLPVVTNLEYFYPALATDADGDLLTYSLVTGPDGATIDTATGAIAWNPPAVGDYTFSIQADDGRGGTAIQDFVVVVNAVNADNAAPTITSTPAVTTVDAAQTFTYDVEATDPDGDVLAYYLTEAPAGLSINQETGVISWTPTNEQAGSNVVAVQVLDGKGKSATQQFEVVVNSTVPNRAPFFSSSPLTTALTGSDYQYQPLAIDPEGDTLTYSLLQQPDGMEIDPDTGLITWPSGAIAVGDYTVVIAVLDSAGNTTQQTFEITANDGTIVDVSAPEIALTFDNPIVAPGNSVNLQVSATDDRDLASLEVTLNGSSVALSPNTTVNGQLYTASVQLDAAGVYEVVATAIDSAGNTSVETFDLRAADPSDVTPPDITLDLTGLDAGKPLSTAYDVSGTVTDENLAFYQVEYAPTRLVDLENPAEFDADYTIFSEGNANADGVLGTFDPRFLANDEYFVRVVAEDLSGNRSAEGFVVGVATENKVGNFTLDATDLNLPLTGIPITVQRRYDTLLANSSASFGYGWEFAGLDARISESAPVTDGPGTADFFTGTAFKAGDRVTLTAPSGERIGFTFTPEPVLNSFFGTVFQPKFTPDPGVEEILTVDPINLSQKADGSFGLYLFGFGFNPSEYKLTTKDNLTYTYDQFTGLQTVSDLNNNVLTYSDDGILSSTGEAVRFERDSEGRITEIVDPSGNSIGYQYNAEGDLVAVTDRAGNVTRYEYEDPDRDHYLTNEIDPLGRSSVRTEFDELGRIERIIDAEGNALEIDIDFDGPVDTQIVTDPLNFKTTLVYDERGNVLQQIDAEGGVTEYEYFDDNRLKSLTDPRGGKTSYTYDGRGNLLTETNALNHTTTYTYNALNQVESITDARNFKTINRYDEFGNLLETEDASNNVTEYDYYANGLLRTVTDAEENETGYTYDAFGQLETLTDAAGGVTRFSYDNSGNLKTVTTPLGNTTTFGYDGDGNLIRIVDAKGNKTEIQYNAAGDRTAVIDALGRRTSYTYNDRGLLERTQFADGTAAETVYDALDRVISEIDQNGNATEFDYDGLGRLIKVTDALNKETDYTYDESGNLSAVEDALGRVTNYDYDLANQLLKTELPLGQFETYTYDPVGNLKTLTNFNEQTITYEYDPTNLLSAVRLPDATDELYTYTKTGQVETITDGRGTTQFVYDALDRLEQRTDPEGAFIGYDYDLDGNIESLTTPSGSVTYQYDALGLLESVTDRDNNVTTYSYDNVGNLVTTGFGNGVTETRDYDLLNRPEIIETQDSSGNTLSRYEYSLDNVGNRLSVEEHTGRTVNYAYDDLYRVTQEQIVDPINGDQTTDYTYDDVGNRISRNNSLDGTTTYSYDDNDRLLTETSGGVVTSYDYDDAGNLTAKAVAGSTEATYQWNSKGELIGVTVNDNGVGQSIQYQYDTNGIRVSQIVDGQVTHFLIDNEQQEFAQVIEEYTNGIVNVSYTHGLDLISQQRGNESFFYHTDGLGSTRLLTNNFETVVNNYVYDAYGEVISKTEGVENLYQFAGEQFRSSTGLQYLRARYMSTSLGRFISRDPFFGFVERPLSINKYGYVEGNPINAVDPSGEVTAIEYIVLLSGSIGLGIAVGCEKAPDDGDGSDALANAAETGIPGIATILTATQLATSFAGLFLLSASFGTLFCTIRNQKS